MAIMDDFPPISRINMKAGAGPINDRPPGRRGQLRLCHRHTIPQIYVRKSYCAPIVEHFYNGLVNLWDIYVVHRFCDFSARSVGELSLLFCVSLDWNGTGLNKD